MAADFDRGVAFVRAHGNEFDQARLDALLHVGALPSDEQEARFLVDQRGDGGWAPFWASDYSSLDATCFRLAQAELLFMPLFDRSLMRAVDFLRARQRKDGSWEEDEAVAEQAPPWAKPGSMATCLYLTANCGIYLAGTSAYGDKYGGASHREAAESASTFLKQHLAPDGTLPSFLHTYWLAAALWGRLNGAGNDLPSPERLIFDHLAAQLDDETPAGALGWLLTTLGPLGVPSADPAIAKAAALLATQQRPDGGWTSEDGSDNDAYVTVQALQALRATHTLAPREAT